MLYFLCGPSTFPLPEVPSMLTRQWSKSDMIALLDSRPVFVERALVALYARQTADEQRADVTSHTNGIGFSGCDANILSQFAKWVTAGEAKGIPAGKRLSQKQRDLTVKKLKKYTRQLIEIAEEKAA